MPCQTPPASRPCSRPRRPRLHLHLLCGAALLFAWGCAPKSPTPTPEQEDAPAKEAVAAAPSVDPSAEATPAETPPSTASAKLLSWLDPDATSVAYLRHDRTLHGERLATIFGLPPNLEDAVKAPSDLTWALGVLLDADHPDAVHGWFDDDVLVMRPRVANGLYVLRRLEKPADEMKAALQQHGTLSESEGFAVFSPRSAFPFTMVFVDDEVVAFIPMREIGSGLSPLTAARDLPPSPVETELATILDETRDLSLVALAAGPMTHLDLDHPVGRARVTLRRLSNGLIDGEVAYQMLAPEHAEHAIGQLGERTVFADNERIKGLARKVAFTRDADVVNGRLQLPRSDADVLEDPRLKATAP